MKHSFAPAFLLAAAFAWAAAADEPKAAPDWTRTLSLAELLDLELASPAKLGQTSREAPGTASIVTRQQIREFGWTSLNEVLFRQPGFFPSHDYERTTVGSRGLFESWNNNHLLLLIDGVPFNDSEAATAYTWELTPLFIARDVEIIRGPGSALYGSSATNGVVSLNTISASKMLGESGNLEATSFAGVRFGSNATRAIDVLAATRSGFVSAVIGFNHFETAGNEYRSYDGSGRTDASGALQRFTVLDHRESNYFFAKLEGRDLFEGLQLEYHLQSWTSETGLGWLFWAPDVRLPMDESRHVINLRYRSDPARQVSFEAVAMYQRHNEDLQMRFYPVGAFDGAYPAGVTEVLSFATEELFARAQASLRIGEKAVLLGGIETSVFLYGGDSSHFANADLENKAGGYPASETPVQLGPSYEPVLNHPVWTVSPYSQLTLTRLFDQPLSLTAGVRFDSKFFNYKDLESGEQRSKSFQHLSPRLALVLTPLAGVSLKAQASKAFRAPSSVELFAAHTWSESANLEGLRPEKITTVEAGLDVAISPRLTVRLNVFNTRYENTLFYGSESKIVNLLSHRVAGLETELLGELPLGAVGTLSGFANHTYVKLLSESSGDPTLGSARGRLAWAPEHSAKAGVAFRAGSLTLSLQGIYQGEVRRRDADSVDPTFAAARPGSVAPWTSFDLAARYRLPHAVTLSVRATNLLDTAGYLVKGGSFPFDYRTDGRQVFGSVELDL